MRTMLTFNIKLASLITLVAGIIPTTMIAQNLSDPHSTIYADVHQSIHSFAVDELPIIQQQALRPNLTRFSSINYQEAAEDTVPNPKSVMFKSLILPGWGQVTNKQIWKIPIIYGLIGGVTAYTFYAHNRYQGYRAAYYNSFDENTDLKFGPTPDFVPAGQPPELYRTNRNNFRNRRDMAIIGILVAYGLNVADAYIFAHLRDFDVSDDLAGRVVVDTDYFAGLTYTNLKLTFNF